MCSAIISLLAIQHGSSTCGFQHIELYNPALNFHKALSNQNGTTITSNCTKHFRQKEAAIVQTSDFYTLC